MELGGCMHSSCSLACMMFQEDQPEFYNFCKYCGCERHFHMHEVNKTGKKINIVEVDSDAEGGPGVSPGVSKTPRMVSPGDRPVSKKAKNA